jgi:hypothetical protein
MREPKKKATAAKLRAWRASMLRSRAVYLGIVYAANEKSAEAAAVAEFKIARTHHPSRYRQGKAGMLGIIGGAALLTVASFSLQWSQDEISLSLNSANDVSGSKYALQKQMRG